MYCMGLSLIHITTSFQLAPIAQLVEHYHWYQGWSPIYAWIFQTFLATSEVALITTRIIHWNFINIIMENESWFLTSFFFLQKLLCKPNMIINDYKVFRSIQCNSLPTCNIWPAYFLPPRKDFVSLVTLLSYFIIFLFNEMQISG